VTDQNNVIQLLPLYFIGDIKNVGIKIEVGLQQMGAFADPPLALGRKLRVRLERGFSPLGASTKRHAMHREQARSSPYRSQPVKAQQGINVGRLRPRRQQLSLLRNLEAH
jgi:hypothetical protein